MDTIEKLVLPELPRASWSSGYLHSALVILALAKDQVSGAKERLLVEYEGLSDLLRESRDLIASNEIKIAIDDALHQSGRLPPMIADAKLQDLCEDLSVVANHVIEHSYSIRDGETKRKLLALIAAYRATAAAQMSNAISNAAGRPIF